MRVWVWLPEQVPEWALWQGLPQARQHRRCSLRVTQQLPRLAQALQRLLPVWWALPLERRRAESQVQRPLTHCRWQAQSP